MRNDVWMGAKGMKEVGFAPAEEVTKVIRVGDNDSVWSDADEGPILCVQLERPQMLLLVGEVDGREPQARDGRKERPRDGVERVKIATIECSDKEQPDDQGRPVRPEDLWCLLDHYGASCSL